MRGASEVLACGRGDRHAVQRCRGVREVGRALALEVGDQHQTARAGLGLQREVGERVELDVEQLCRGDEYARGVQGRDQRQVAAGRVGEAGDGAALIGGRIVGDREHRAARPDRDDHVAGPRAEPERGAGVVTGARADGDACGYATGALAGGDSVAGRIVRAEHAWQGDVAAPEPAFEQVKVVLARGGVEVGGAGGV